MRNLVDLAFPFIKHYMISSQDLDEWVRGVHKSLQALWPVAKWQKHTRVFSRPPGTPAIPEINKDHWAEEGQHT